VTKTGTVLASPAAHTLADASTTTPGAANIKANISELVPEDAGRRSAAGRDRRLVRQRLRFRYESKGAATAWTAVCATLVRDPLWFCTDETQIVARPHSARRRPGCWRAFLPAWRARQSTTDTPDKLLTLFMGGGWMSLFTFCPLSDAQITAAIPLHS